MKRHTANMKSDLFLNMVLKLAVIVSALFLVAPFATAKELTWTGCDISMTAFMEKIAKAYEKKTGVKIKLSGGGATKGIRAVSARSSDMGGTCRHRLVDVKGAIHEEERDAELVHVAWDALVVITHRDNPVNNISLADLKRVYDGKITSWKDLGAEDKRIVLVTLGGQGKYSGVEHMFRWLVYNDPEYDFKALSHIVKSSGSLRAKFEKTPWSLGLDGVSAAIKRQVKILSLDGISPSKENIASGKYPLFRPLYLAVNKNIKNPEVKKFIDFISSPEGQAIISEQGTVNLTEGKALAPLWDEKKARFGLK